MMGLEEDRSRAPNRAAFWYAAAAGVTVGFGAAALVDSSLVTIVVLIGLACLGEWLEVRLVPGICLTLRPVIAFVALQQQGLAGLFVVGLAALLLVRFVSRSRVLDTFSEAGLDAVSLWMGYVSAMLATGFVGSVLVGGLERDAVASVAGLVGYWTVNVLVKGARLSVSEGLSTRSALRYLLARAWPHMTAFAVIGLALQFVSVEFDLFIVALAAVIVVETYYPWKLIGDQEGVLLTSLKVMAQAVDLKDPYTSNHSQRVAQYAVRLARAIGLSESEVERIRIGALMHDIGKIGISGAIIRKPGKLTPEEQSLMRQHSTVSANIIAPLEILGESADMVRHHHEHWNGSGYPDGLRGDAIPLGSRIILVADAYDALSTDRPYRKGTKKAHALSVIRENAGTQFDPVVVEALERIVDAL
ncbi:MAG: HD-GYP domain-containing protein [Armatimonadota bacterium]|nr:HD-GYP domain-containing protein [Armatimonadota bacterium]